MTDIISPIPVNANEHLLREMPVRRAITSLAVPTMFALSAGVIYNIINALFLATLHSTPILAAITYGLPIYLLAGAIGGVFGAGGGSYVARLLGAGQPEKIRAVSAFMIYGALLSGILLSAGCLLFFKDLIILIGTDFRSIIPTYDYVLVLVLWGPVFVVNLAVQQLVRALGAARQAMYGLLISAAANLMFDVLFILILHWNVGGAALALGLSSFIGIIYYLTYLRRHQPLVGLAPTRIRVNLTILKEVLGVGSSELIQSGFLLVSALLLNHLAAAYDTGLLAAFGIALRIVQLPQSLMLGISVGVLPLLAYSHGAGLTERLRQALVWAMVWIAGVVVLLCGTLLILHSVVIGWFSQDFAVKLYGQQVLTAMLIWVSLNGFTGLLLAYFQGRGHGKLAAVTGLGLGVFFIPFLLLGQQYFGATGLIVALPAGGVLALVVGLVLFLVTSRQAATKEG